MLTISLPHPVEARLITEAKRHGTDAASYASQLLEHALSVPSIEDVMATFREQVAASGLSDNELDNLFQEARQEAWEDRQGKGK